MTADPNTVAEDAAGAGVVPEDAPAATEAEGRNTRSTSTSLTLLSNTTFRRRVPTLTTLGPQTAPPDRGEELGTELCSLSLAHSGEFPPINRPLHHYKPQGATTSDQPTGAPPAPAISGSVVSLLPIPPDHAHTTVTVVVSLVNPQRACARGLLYLLSVCLSV